MSLGRSLALLHHASNTVMFGLVHCAWTGLRCRLRHQLQAHSQNDISDIYRFPLVTKGIFVNPALQEPFGLTVIEVRCRAVRER
jgi:hypothetical protein